MNIIVDSPTAKVELPVRLRRKRQSPAIRSLLQETYLQPSNLVAPLFVVEGNQQLQPIASMPDIFRFSLDLLVKEVRELRSLGIKAINLFFYVSNEKKDELGSEAFRPGNLLQRTISLLKEDMNDLCIMADIALDPYTDHGHDGALNQFGDVDNDLTLELLGKMSLLAAEAGADFISPSDMMDGRVGYLRKLLDGAGYSRVGILSYAAKFVSSFYRPFRHALDSAPKLGDKKSYQLNPANAREALLECKLDEEEGADMLLIKPALPYLDILAKVKEKTLLPVGAYHVSGEYAMLMAAVKEGWLDKEHALSETLLSIKRAGADFIFTYGAKEMAKILQKGGC